jgi:hypothetical protein
MQQGHRRPVKLNNPQNAASLLVSRFQLERHGEVVGEPCGGRKWSRSGMIYLSVPL